MLKFLASSRRIFYILKSYSISIYYIMPYSSIFISGPGHLPETHFPETLEVLKLWFPDQQHQYHLGTRQKCKFSGVTPETEVTRSSPSQRILTLMRYGESQQCNKPTRASHLSSGLRSSAIERIQTNVILKCSN